MCRIAVHRMHNYWIVCRIIRPWNSIDWLKLYSRPADICSIMTASSNNKFATTSHSLPSSMLQLRYVFFFSLVNRFGIDEQTCARILSIYHLPPGDLLDECEAIHRPDVKGLNTYRRLLPAKYADGLYKVFGQMNPIRCD